MRSTIVKWKLEFKNHGVVQVSDENLNELLRESEIEEFLKNKARNEIMKSIDDINISWTITDKELMTPDEFDAIKFGKNTIAMVNNELIWWYVNIVDFDSRSIYIAGDIEYKIGSIIDIIDIKDHTGDYPIEE